MKKTFSSRDFFAYHRWKLIVPILVFFLPYICVGFGIYWFGYKNEDGAITHPTGSEAFYIAIESIFTLFFSFFLVLFTFLFMISKKNNEEQNELIRLLTDEADSIKNDVSQYLNKAKIVFSEAIAPYDDSHISALGIILDKLNQSESDIHLLALDSTEPQTWWSDTMTGYLALLAKWQSEGSKTKIISRVFICRKNELLSPIFAKTISLHALMGFNTYIISLEDFNNFYNQIRSHQNVPAGVELGAFNKELLLWLTPQGDNICVDFTIDKKEWSSVKCYQSFWDVNLDYQLRKKDAMSQIKALKNYYNSSITDKEIGLYFEFMAKENRDPTPEDNPSKYHNHNELPRLYKELLELIIGNSICCKDKREVIGINRASPFGIKVKTCACSKCAKSQSCSINKKTNESFYNHTSPTNVNEILNEFYKKLN